MFAEEIAGEIFRRSEPALVMLQDYHLYLVARQLREILGSDADETNKIPIMHFIHIPWPGPEYWGILPPTFRQSILDSLCAVDLLGLQTREDGLNFIRTCETYLPQATVKYARGRIWYRNHATYVRDFPITIDTNTLKTLAESHEIEGYRSEIQDITKKCKLILRIDRIDPSKNIVRGFKAYEEMLEIHPEHREQVLFLAILVPSRMEVGEYQNYLDELMASAGRVNALYGNSQWEPVRILVGDDYPRAVAAMQLYDVLLVNAIADGMNLVAKEGPLINRKNGVLILSEKTGARQQLETGATVISPCDIYATSEALHQALSMPEQERTERSNRLKWLLEQEDIYSWLDDQIEALAKLYRLRGNSIG
jgi:trehalose 6-phosphate synthase